jgi:hypothetical protein
MAARVIAANPHAESSSELLPRLARMADPFGSPALTDGTRLGARLAMAEVALREGRTDDAEQHSTRVLAGEGTLRVEHGYRARALMLLGLARQGQGRHPEALQSLSDAEKEYVSAFGVDHTEALLCRSYEAPSLLAVSGAASAAALIDSTLPTLRARMPVGAPVISKLVAARSALSTPSTGAHSTAGRAVFF